MRTISVKQGSGEWLALRAKHHTASEAPAMMGASRHQSRDQLLHQKATGITPEIDRHLQAIFDRGHATEAAARVLLEQDMGDDFYPITAVDNADYLLASFDGVTMDGETGYEHKLFSEELAQQVLAGDLEPHYYWQLEQQILVGGLKRVIFVTSDGTRDNWAQMEYWPVPGRAEALMAGWAQLDKDVAAYVAPAPKAAPVVAAPMETLPAVSVRVDGHLAIISNLPDFGAALRHFIARIPDAPNTDQEFADTEAACKALKKAEDALEASESNALAQLEDVDAMRRMVADFRSLARTTRLQKEKLVTQRKEQLRGEAVAAGVAALRQHIAELNASVGKPWVEVIPTNFGGVIKGMRSLDSIRGAVNDELARAKIDADAQARRIAANIKTLDAAGHAFLFPDAQRIATACDAEACADVVHARVVQHQAAEAARLAAERERIRAEEQAKAQREAAAEVARQAREAQRAAQAQREQEQKDARAAAIMEEKAAQAQADAQTQAVVAKAAQQAIEQVHARQAEAASAQPASPPWECAAPAAVPAATEVQTINLSAINEHLAPISLNAAGLALLGFEPVATVKASKLYRESDLPRIRAALVRHLEHLENAAREAA